MSTVDLTNTIMEKMKPAKIIKEHTKDIVGLEFSNDGEILYVADSQTLNVYLTANAQCYRKLFMKTHEIEQLSRTHNNSAVLVATKKNHLILYWSIHENRVIKVFKGHNDTITNLVINPRDDTFITTSNDNTMRIWNLNSNAQGKNRLIKTANSSSTLSQRACRLTQWQISTPREWLSESPGRFSRRTSKW
jgi:COMPASS component SWD2